MQAIKTKLIKRNPLEIIKLIVILVILGGATQIVASFLLTAVLDMMPDVAEAYVQNISEILKPTLHMMFLVCVVAPALEELVFRGLILGILSRFTPFLIANIIQAVAFAIYHGNLVQGVYAFILGLFIGYICKVTGLFVYTMILHIGINLAGMYIDSLIPEETPFLIKLAVMIVSLIIAVSCTMAILKMRTDNK